MRFYYIWTPSPVRKTTVSHIYIYIYIFHNISTYYYIIILVTSLPVFNNVVAIDADVV